MSHARKPSGFSLIESLVALAVFSIGILGVMQMNVMASQQNGLARRQSTASKLGRDLVDAFERLPFDHPLLSTESTLSPRESRFLDFDETNGRMTLTDAVALAGQRPLLGAAHASVSAEGSYEVAWRVSPMKVEGGLTEARRIVVMVRFPTTAGGFKQVNVWTVKSNPQVMGWGSATIPEI